MSSFLRLVFVGMIVPLMLLAALPAAAQQIAVLEHDTARGEYNSLVQVNATTYALAYSGDGSDGYITTFAISADGASITEVNSLEHDTVVGQHNSLVQVDADTFALAYRGSAGHGFVTTFTISADGATITEVYSLEHDTTAGQHNSLVQVDADTFALAYAGADADGFITTFTISADGATITEVYSLEHDTVNGQYNSLVQVNATTYALAYSGDGSDGFIKTFTISANGSAITEVYSLEHNTDQGQHNSLVQVNADTYALAFHDSVAGAAFIKTFTISADGSSVAEVSSLQYSATGWYTSLAKVDADTYALAYYGTQGKGYVDTFAISADGATISEVSSLQHSTLGGYNSLVQVVGDTYALAYTGAGNDGFIKTFNITGPLEWTGAGDGVSVYQEANWIEAYTGTPPPAGTVDPSTDIDWVMFAASGTPGGSIGATDHLQLGALGSLDLSGPTVWRMDPTDLAGIRARDPALGDQPNRPVSVADTAHVLTQFLLDIDLAASGSASVTFYDGGDPLDRSTVAVSGYDVIFNFPGETTADFASEHVSKFTVNSSPAELGADPTVWEAGDNLLAVSDGASGCIVTLRPPSGVCLVEANGDPYTDYMSDDHSALQTAIDAATAGDTIKVAGACAGGGTVVTTGLTIEGGHTASDWLASPDPLTYPTLLDAAGSGRVMDIIGALTVTLEALTLTGGDAGTGNGGALQINGGDVTIVACTFSNNNAYDGGGIAADSSTVSISGSTITNNSATTAGAGMFIASDLNLSNSTVNNNTGDFALITESTNVAITNCTISTNTAIAGVLINTPPSPAAINFSTIAFNTGTGFFLDNAEAHLSNTIIAGNTTNCVYNGATTQTVSGVNISDDMTCTGFTLADPQIEALADNGGLTLTHALPVSSPAVDVIAFGSDGCGTTVITDQRDVSRPQLAGCDAGAYEFEADPIYVDIDATAGADNGASWTDAYTALQDALQVAVDGDVLWIAEGVYYPDVGVAQTPDDANSTFTIVDGVSVLGGFSANPAQPSERDLNAFPVVLSGDIDENDVNSDGNFVNETWNDIVGLNAHPVVTLGNDLTLDGMTVTAGWADAADGGGILCSGAGAGTTLRNLLVSGNDIPNDSGGGVYGCDQTEMESSVISGNRASGGGGWFGGGTFRDVAFSGNEAGIGGGAIRGQPLDLARCALVGNSGHNGGAVRTPGPLTMETVLMSGNYATGDGGAIRLYSGGAATLKNVTMTGNWAASLAGGLLVNTTKTVDISNSIFWNNHDSSGTGTLSSSITDSFSGGITVSASILQSSGGSAAWIPTDLVDGGNNLDLDPMFVTAVDPATAPTTDGDTHLLTGSPAVDTGENTFVTTATDLDGEDRIQNGTVDMGPYEGAEVAADLAISKTDGLTSATPGASLTYTIVASNTGPSDALSVSVVDTFPAALTCNWSSIAAGGATGNTNSSGDIAETLAMPVGSSVTYTAICDIDPGATGALSNTATISSAVFDPDTGNNSATDDDTVLVPSADLAISKTDGVTSAVPGESVTYTIVASTSGPSVATPVTVSDTFPANLTCNWSSVASGGATGNTNGSGDINETLNMPVSSSVVYTAVCAIDPSSTGTLSNTATISSAVGDPVPGNNSATDDDTVLSLEADLAIDKDDGVRVAEPGDTLTYTIAVTNSGPSDVAGAVVEDLFPADLTCTWSSVASGGASGNGSGSGNISETINLPASSSVTYTAMCDVDPDAMYEQLTNTATLTAPAGVTDPDLGNNSASDTDLGPLVFVDGFESGDTSLWSATAGAAKGLAEVPAPGDKLLIALVIDLQKPGRSQVIGVADSGAAVLRLDLVGRPGELRVVMNARLDNGQWLTTTELLLASADPTLELEWRRAFEPGANNGEIYLSADGTTLAWLTDLDTDDQAIREIVSVGDLEVQLRRK